jgi:hypothetical protein
MKVLSILGKILAVTGVLFLAQIVGGMVIADKSASAPPNLAGPLLYNLVNACVVAIASLGSRWRGLRLALALMALPFGVTIANMVEAYYFLPVAKAHALLWIAQSCIGYAVAVPCCLLIFRKSGNDETGAGKNSGIVAVRNGGEILWKFAVSDLAFIVCYFIAGLIILPYTRSFYLAQGPLPTLSLVLGVQLLFRGPLFMGLCLLLFQMLGLQRVRGAIAAGALFAILGVAPLTMPNSYMPDYVRHVHFFEILGSYLVFGIIIGLLWGRTKTTSQVLSQAA